MKLEDIVEHYGTMVATIANRMIQNREIAKEAAQEVWYEVFKSLPSFNADSELSTWIYTIAKRTISRYAQNEKVATLVKLEQFRALQEIEYTGSDEERKEWVKERCDWCLTALNHCLNNDARLIFIFKENIGLSHKEIGEIMGKSENWARVSYYRAKERLKKEVEENE
jgi:RNA polymerase sigma factor (sigma-70 family)